MSKKMTMTEAATKGLLSEDIAEKKRAQLEQLFPEVFVDGKIDFEQLRRVMGDWIEPGKERYGLNWPGRAECMKVIQTPSPATLKPARDESVDFDKTGNLFIEGDNLEVLKLLHKSYFGKVKMIYIDPPYNTGNEFIYPDDYQENLATYLAYTGQVNDKGRKFSTNTDSGGRYHSNWLKMMYPRLYLARSLLCEGGVIFISIDDNEVGNLRGLCDFVFGQDNFINNIIWQKKYTRANDAQWFSDNHDHILVYAKSKKDFKVNHLPRNGEQEASYKNPDDHKKGPWRGTPLHAKSGSNTKAYTFKNGVTWAPPAGTFRRFNDQSMREMDEKNEIWFGEDGNQTPRRKSFLSEVKAGVVPVTIWLHSEVGHNHEANNDVKALGLGGVFNNPKPIRLIENIIALTCDQESEDMILDFFAGSCTTAHAVMNFNSKNNSKLKYVMVQLPEPCDKKSAAFGSGFKTIADIGKERIRRSAQKIKEAIEGKLDLQDQAKLDLGFKVFKLAPSNFAIWNGDVDTIDDLEQQMQKHIDHIDKTSGSEDILYELLLKAGYELPTKVSKVVMAGKDVYAIDGGSLLICLDKEITPELIDALANAHPSQVICLDEGFRGNDQLKANAVQTFESHAQAQESEIVFRTV